ncbi:hypothetical protein GPK77_07205 [Butyricicoccus faecihominis]|nr:hypothetical protein [Butyricicoccus faecihominis]MBT9817506.1 hypothetical protein [Butyricicoccus faecihominis]
MDTAFMRKTFALIAKGLIEKEQLLQTEPTRYPYSKAMQHGINMFLAASQWAGSQAAVEYPDEVSFLTHFITRPVEKWFDTWESGAVEQLHLQEEPFYAYDAFAYQKAGNVYVPSSDCYEFLETQDSDIMNGTDERILYEKIITLSQEDYCRVRRYMIGFCRIGGRCIQGKQMQNRFDRRKSGKRHRLFHALKSCRKRSVPAVPALIHHCMLPPSS